MLDRVSVHFESCSAAFQKQCAVPRLLKWEVANICWQQLVMGWFVLSKAANIWDQDAQDPELSVGLHRSVPILDGEAWAH